MSKRKTTEEFIADARKVHGDKYDYSKVEYAGNKKDVCIICPEHGEFWQTPNNHLKPQDCPYCKHRGYKYTTKEYVEKASIVHNNKYDYKNVNYVNMKSIISIICPIHGEFLQDAHNHIRGAGCGECSGRMRKTKEQFVKDASKIHNGKYKYDNVNYVNNKTEVYITCPIHGDFKQKPNKHLLGEGCPSCNQSKLESEIKAFLIENNIDFIEQATKSNLEWLELQSLDFYLPRYKTAIECQGEQHYKPVLVWGGDETFKSIQERDQRKAQKCNDNGVKILYFGKEIHKKYDQELISSKNKLLEKIYGI